MEKELTYTDFEILFEGIKNCGNQTKQPFRTKMLRNSIDIKKELDSIYETLQKPEGWDDFGKKEGHIIDMYSIGTDHKGQPLFGENKEEAERKLIKLREENAVLIEKYKEIQKDFRTNVMNMPVTTVKLRFIAETELPKELTLSQLMGIDKLITFSPDEIGTPTQVHKAKNIK